MKKAAIKALPQVKLARGEFKLDGYESLRKMGLEKSCKRW